MADLTNEFVTQIKEAVAQKRPLIIEGSGSKRWYGNVVAGHRTLSTAGHTGILDYDPAELVLTARAGTTIAELEKGLADRGQMLPFEPPRYSSESTLGGVIAAGLSGPARPYAGGVRDFVLGLHIVDGKGDVLKFGGQVMKNVAGYDVSRLMTGSLGVLGLITQVSLKVLPVSLAQSTLCFALSEAAAIHQVNAWSAKPLPITGSVWHQGVLNVRLAGARAAVASAEQQLGGTKLAPEVAAKLWLDLQDQTHAFFGSASAMVGQRSLWRLSLPAIAPAIDAALIPGAQDQLIEWGGAQRWLWSDASPEAIRQLARSLGGHAVLFNNQHAVGDVFDKLPPPLLAIHQRLKNTFDPHGIFNPGRLCQGL
jgi:glycolate oxidase FAD binding subunit